MPDAQSVGRSERRQLTLTKQACDACKLRKVKCIYNESTASSELSHQPCQRCLRLTIDCTFSLPQKCRGPRRLRRDTRYVFRHLSDSRIDLTEDFAAAMRLVKRSRVGRRQRSMPYLPHDPDQAMQHRSLWRRG